MKKPDGTIEQAKFKCKPGADPSDEKSCVRIDKPGQIGDKIISSEFYGSVGYDPNNCSTEMG